MHPSEAGIFGVGVGSLVVSRVLGSGVVEIVVGSGVVDSGVVGSGVVVSRVVNSGVVELVVDSGVVESVVGSIVVTTSPQQEISRLIHTPFTFWLILMGSNVAPDPHCDNPHDPSCE